MHTSKVNRNTPASSRADREASSLSAAPLSNPVAHSAAVSALSSPRRFGYSLSEIAARASAEAAPGAVQLLADKVSGAPSPSGSDAARTNRTGMPDRLKSGVEALSGLSLDNVRVHRNSPRPAALGALAYAQGADIHVAPGQDKHLPHEAWHVVQQAQGRVRPTVQMKGNVPVNDDKRLEAEADLMGVKACQFTDNRPETVAQRIAPGTAHDNSQVKHLPPVQRMVNSNSPTRNHSRPIQMSGGSSKANEELKKAMGRGGDLVDKLPKAKPHTKTGTGSGGGTDHQARNAMVINKAKQDTMKAHDDPTMFASSQMRSAATGKIKEIAASEKRKEKAEGVDNTMADYQKALVQATTTYKGDQEGFDAYLLRKEFTFSDDQLDELYAAI